MNGMIFHKCLDCLVGSKTKSFVKLSRSSVAVFGTLPEESVVVAQEWSVLHLRLMLENRITLEAQFLRADRHRHFDMVDFPLCPRAAIHPYAAVFHPWLIDEFIDSGEHCIGAHTVCAVRVGEVACHEYLVRLHITDKFLHDIHVAASEVSLLDRTGLIERQLAEVNVFGLDADIVACCSSLALADFPFQVAHGLNVDVTGVLLVDKAVYFVAQAAILVGVDTEAVAYTVHEHHIAHHILVAHSDVARCLVSHMHIVVLIHESLQSAAHRDYVVVGVRTEHNHTLWIWVGTLRAI